MRKIILRYSLCFDIPSELDGKISAEQAVSLTLNRSRDIILDFSEPSLINGEVNVNGTPIQPQYVNNHIIIPSKYTKAGGNTVAISFKVRQVAMNK